MSREGSTAAVTSIPLSTLRPDFDGGWPLGSRWTIPEASEGSSVEQPEGSVLAFRIRGATGARLRARVRILPGDAGPSGAIRARVVLRGERRREVWSGLLPVLRGRSVAAAQEIEVPLEAEGRYELLLCASRLQPLGKGGARLRWEDPRIEVPAPEPPVEPRPARTSEAAAPVGETLRPDPGSPLFSILTPVHNPPPAVLEETLASVRDQSFRDWEMRLVDDGSTDPEVIRILERACAEDERMHLTRNPQARGISAATNSALGAARGEFIALLDHDDVLAADALETVAATIAADPGIDILYSDEDVFDDGRRLALFVKPHWSPDLMRSHMYTCHLGVYRRRIADEIGGFRSDFDGSQDYDFFLRMSERSDRIVHIPKVLYHWRSHRGSVAEDLAAKPHAYAAARRSIAEHLERLGVEGEVHFDALRCWYRVDYEAPAEQKVALVLPLAADDDPATLGLERAAAAWSRTEGSNWELVLVGPEPAPKRCAAALAELEDRGQLRLLSTEAGLGRASLLNRALLETAAECVVVLEHPVAQLTGNWLSRLRSLAVQDGIGAAGAKTLAADGRVEHGGLVLRDGLPTPVQLAADQIEPGPMAVLYVRANFSSLSGTVAIARKTLERLGGFDERFDTLAVPDFCLRAWDEGMRIVSAPDAVVRRTDRGAALNDIGELAAFAARWRSRLPEDPYFGPRAAAVLTGVGPAR